MICFVTAVISVGLILICGKWDTIDFYIKKILCTHVNRKKMGWGKGSLALLRKIEVHVNRNLSLSSDSRLYVPYLIHIWTMWGRRQLTWCKTSLNSKVDDDRSRVKTSHSFGIDYLHCWSPSRRLIGYWDLTIEAFNDRGAKGQWRTALFRQVSMLNSRLLQVGPGDTSATQASPTPLFEEGGEIDEDRVGRIDRVFFLFVSKIILYEFNR